MIEKKKNLKPEMRRPVLVMFSTFLLTCGAATSMNAQNCEKQTVTFMSGSADQIDDKISISHVTFDSTSTGIPGFPEGTQSIFAFLKKNITYSLKAIEAKIQGEVAVKFTVTKEGTLSNCRITKSLCPDLDKEVMEAVKKLPVHKPLAKDGQKTDADYAVTLAFALPDGTLQMKPTVSVVEIEIESMKLTVKCKDAINMEAVTDCSSTGKGKDTIYTKMATIVIRER